SLARPHIGSPYGQHLLSCRRIAHLYPFALFRTVFEAIFKEEKYELFPTQSRHPRKNSHKW
ncbi:MAG: hypothetical protein J6I49_00495, partial [Bacteroidales bacterium]|nr:hypothetical protein [Bacteroidales bacterium]